MLISDNLPVGINYFDSNIIQNKNARILRHFQMDSLEADIARSQMFTTDIIKARNVHVSISNMIYHKFSYGPTSYKLSGKNINAMLEY